MAQSKQLDKLGPQHRELMMKMVAEPEMSNKELAAFFGMSESWISIVTNSDAFKSHYETLRSRIEEEVVLGVLEKTEKLAGKALDFLNEQFEPNEDGMMTVTPKFALEVADTTLKRLTPASGPAAQVNVNLGGTVTPDVLLRAQKRYAKYSEDLAEGPDGAFRVEASPSSESPPPPLIREGDDVGT